MWQVIPERPGLVKSLLSPQVGLCECCPPLLEGRVVLDKEEQQHQLDHDVVVDGTTGPASDQGQLVNNSLVPPD